MRAHLFSLTLAALAASMGCPASDDGSATEGGSATASNDDTQGGSATEPTSGPASVGATETAGETEGEWPVVDCNGTACAAGEVCLRPVPSCQLVPDPCSGGGSGTDSGTGGSGTAGDEPDQCWIEVPRDESCTPIPADCQGTLAEITACLESGSLCPDGGTVTDGVLSCSFNGVDGCEEGENGYYTCQPCL